MSSGTSFEPETLVRRPGVWRTLSFILVAVNGLIASADANLPAADTAYEKGRALGGVLAVIILPLVIIAVLSLAPGFRTATARWKIFFWTSLAVLLSLLTR